MTTAKRVRQEIESYLNRTEGVHVPLDTDPNRLFYLRPSSFPYCGLRFFLDFNRKLEDPRLETFSSSYFTSVGTTIHSVFQAYTAPLGKVVGDWKCPKCGAETKFTTFAVCKCGGHPVYHELELKYKNTVVGHTDCLYRLSPAKGKDSLHAVLDYKSTSTKRVKEDEQAERKHKKRVFPYRSNVAQIESYVPLLEQQYGIQVDYHALIYLARDAPFRHGRRVIVHHIDEDEKRGLYRRLDRSVKVHRKVLSADTRDKLDVVIKYKLCKSFDDFEANWKDEYNPCPHCTSCFNSKALDTKLKETLKLKHIPIVSMAPKSIKKGLDL